VRIGVRVLISLSSDVLLEYDGKHESGYKSWNIDASNVVAPTASLASSNIASDSFTLTASGSDSDSGVAKYEFYINDVKKYEVASSAGSVSWDVNADSYGSEITAETTYTCKVRVYDAAGNWKDSSDIQVVTAKAGPTPWDGTVADGFAGGSGTSSDPYQIETAEQLARVSKYNELKDGTGNGIHFILVSDIDLGGVQDSSGNWSGQEWTPIDLSSFFWSSFDGNGYEIFNIYINNETEDYVGLFSNVHSAMTAAGEISNVIIKSGYIKGRNYVGGIVGSVSMMNFYDCVNDATVIGNNYVGGLAGDSENVSFLGSCVNNGNVTGNQYVGGIVGACSSVPTNCVNNGSVTGNSNFGDLYGIIEAGWEPPCFMAYTQVLTQTGLKNIQDIKTGDKVWSINLETNERELKEIISIRNVPTNILLELQIGNEIITTTPNHRFYVRGKGWLAAEDLSIGDEIISKDNKEGCVVESMKYIYEENAINVYNLTVKDNHNYLVGENNLLVEDYEHSHYKILPSSISNITERAR